MICINKSSKIIINHKGLSSIAQHQSQLVIVAVNQRQLPTVEVLPAKQRHHQGPLLGEIFDPSHIEKRKKPCSRSIFSWSVRKVLIPLVEGRNLQFKYHPTKEGPTNRKCPVAEHSFEAVVTNLPIVEKSYHEETVKRRIVLEESSGAHKNNGCELRYGNIAEDHFLQTNFDVSVVKSLINPDDGSIVDQVEEEEIKQHCIANLVARLFDGIILGSISDNCMSAYPREQFVYIVEGAFSSNLITASQQYDDDCRCRHDSSVDV